MGALGTEALLSEKRLQIITETLKARWPSPGLHTHLDFWGLPEDGHVGLALRMDF